MHEKLLHKWCTDEDVVSSATKVAADDSPLEVLATLLFAATSASRTVVLSAPVAVFLIGPAGTSEPLIPSGPGTGVPLGQVSPLQWTHMSVVVCTAKKG